MPRVSNPPVVVGMVATEVCRRCPQTTLYYPNQVQRIGARQYCITHLVDTYSCCGLCNELVRADEMWSAMNDNLQYCYDCYHETYADCRQCNCSFKKTSLDANGKCETCRSIATINNYSHRPSPNFYKVADEEIFFGIELEVEKKDSLLSRQRMAGEIQRPEFYFKEDGSLSNGFEIVTHPMSYEYIKSQQESLTANLKQLTFRGYKSYDTDTCGMHIHITKTAFTTWHLYRFMRFFNNNKPWIIKMSQRLQSQIDRWTKLTDLERHRVKAKIKNKNEQHDRYQAINLLNDKTVEIRIFRGTLNPTSFFKNIELVQSLYMFTKSAQSRPNLLGSYLEYIEENKETYSSLWKFIEDNNYKSNKIN